MVARELLLPKGNVSKFYRVLLEEGDEAYIFDSICRQEGAVHAFNWLKKRQRARKLRGEPAPVFFPDLFAYANAHPAFEDDTLFAGLEG